MGYIELGGSTAPLDMGGVPVNIDKSYWELDQNWATRNPVPVAVQPVAAAYAQQVPVWPVLGPVVEAFREPLYQAGVGLVDAVQEVVADPFKPLREGPFGIWGNDSSADFGLGGSSGGSFGGNAMAIGGSRVRYGPWGPVPAVSRLETIAKFGRELTDSEFAAHFGYYPGSGRRRFRRRYGGMRYGTGFRGRRSTGRTRRYY